MKITDVSAYPLSSPVRPIQHRSFHGGIRRIRKRDVVLLIIDLADGTRGVAPSGASSSVMREYFEGDSQEAFATAIDERIAPTLEHTSFDGITAVRDALRDIDLPNRVRERARAAIDIALHDIRGKQVGAPVYELLATGTDPTTELPLYASAGMYMEPSGYADQAALIEAAGFTGYKYRPGIGPAADKQTIDRICAGTTDLSVLLDAHTWWKTDKSYDEETVRDLIDYAGNSGVGWVEEPVAPDEYDGYRSLAELGVPLAGGESERDPAGLKSLARTNAVAYLQADVRHHDGFTGCMEIAEWCADKDVQYVPHNFGTWLGLIANAHVTAAAPGANLVEYPVFENDPLINTDADPGMYPFPLAFDIIEESPDIKNGVLTMPDAPGLGVTVDSSVIEEYPFLSGPWTEFAYDSDDWDPHRP